VSLDGIVEAASEYDAARKATFPSEPLIRQARERLESLLYDWACANLEPQDGDPDFYHPSTR